MNVLLAVCLAALTLNDYSSSVQKDVEKKIAQVLESREAADRLTGVISLVASDCFFLQGEQDAIKVILSSSLSAAARGAAKPGTSVTVVGHPSLEGGRVVFVATSIESSGDASSLPVPIKATADDLIAVPSSSRSNATPDINWRRTEITGRTIGKTDSGFAMEVENVPVTIFAASLPAFITDCDRLHPLVRVVGVPELVLDQSSLFGRPRRVMGVKFHVANSDDVILVPDLTYDINRRARWVQIAVIATIVILGGLLILLGAFLVRQGRHSLRTRTIMAERKRMADDLHDTIEQHLVGAGMLLQLGKAAEAREILVRAKREIRDIVWGLKNDDMMRLTPTEMLREYVKAENRKGICRLDAHLSGLPDRLESAAMRDLSLIVREAVGNAIKHGGAKKIALSVDPKPNGGWLLRISNDGKPVDLNHLPGPAEGHFGLEGMKARARRLGATLTLSLRDARTLVTLETE